MSDNEEVGYGKPPRHTRFKKGESGNPSGRPKGAKSLKDIVAAALQAKVWVKDGDRRVQRTKKELLITQLVNKGIGGDPRAIAAVIALAHMVDDSAAANPATDAQADAELVLRALARLKPGGDDAK